MKTNKKRTDKHNKDLSVVIKQINKNGFLNYIEDLKNGTIKFNGYIIDLTATTADKMSICYQILKAIQ